jgi:hypothetical protein
MGSGMTGASPTVFALAPAQGSLFVGGRFTEAGGHESLAIARWDD